MSAPDQSIEEVQVQRLERLRDLLASIPKEQYNHESYITKLGGPTCGTVACALGHAAANNHLFPGLDLAARWGEGARYGMLTLRDGTATISEHVIADEYFGNDTYDRVFCTSAYDDDDEGDYPDPADITPEIVVARINELIEERRSA